jgi:hypothetical protein
MSRQPELNHLMTAWQSQGREGVAMSLPQLEARLKSHRQANTVRTLTFYAAFAAYVAFAIWARTIPSGELPLWIEFVRFGLLTGWVSVWASYMLAKKGKEFTTLSLNADAAVPGLEFYRNQLIDRLDYFRDGYWRNTQMGMLAFAFIINAIVYPRLIIPFLLLIGFWAALFFRQKSRQLPVLERELAALDIFRRADLKGG